MPTSHDMGINSLLYRFIFFTRHFLGGEGGGGVSVAPSSLFCHCSPL